MNEQRAVTVQGSVAKLWQVGPGASEEARRIAAALLGSMN